jgi:hypothetical protein
LHKKSDNQNNISPDTAATTSNHYESFFKSFNYKYSLDNNLENMMSNSNNNNNSALPENEIAKYNKYKELIGSSKPVIIFLFFMLPSNY